MTAAHSYKSAAVVHETQTDICTPFSIVVPTVYGQMILNRNDINQTNALLRTGRSLDDDEITMLARIMAVLPVNPVVIDVGANFGAFALGLSHVVGPLGTVHAFEPQRIIFNMLAGSVALNSMLNVRCYNMAVGDHEGRVEIPQFDYSQPLNFGSVEFGGEQREKLTQPRQHDPNRLEFVPLTTLDHFNFERVDVLKIDVEGMEMQVLAGATETIRRCRPVMFVEFLKVDQNALRQRIMDFGYVVYGNKINFLCVPSERREQIQIENGKIEITR
jgi:FkbM family methyltransferase